MQSNHIIAMVGVGRVGEAEAGRTKIFSPYLMLLTVFLHLSDPFFLHTNVVEEYLYMERLVLETVKRDGILYYRVQMFVL